MIFFVSSNFYDLTNLSLKCARSWVISGSYKFVSKTSFHNFTPLIIANLDGDTVVRVTRKKEAVVEEKAAIVSLVWVGHVLGQQLWGTHRHTD